MRLLLDTHAWAWSLTGDDGHFSTKVKDAIAQAEAVFVSPISLFEIGQKVRIGKWPQMQPFLPRLVGLVEEQGGRHARLTPEMLLSSAVLDWDHRDPFDRIIGVTALDMGLFLVSADVVFDDLKDRSGWHGRIW